MRSEYLAFSPPLIGQEEIDEVIDTLRSGWVTTGPKAKKFETQFAERLGAPAALALNSCTAGLHIALKTLGIGPGDEVITTAWTFAATVNVIEHVGATPVIVDVEPSTLNMDMESLERAITEKTKAVMPVHFAGHPVDMDTLEDLASRYDFHIIEDAAHAIGADYCGRPIGSSGHPTAFSFYATKNLVTGEGGMLTGSAEFLDEARSISLHGMSREAWGRYKHGGKWAYDVVSPGFKYNMSDIQAALGIGQLRRFDAMQSRRHEIVGQYQQAFESLGVFDLPISQPHIKHAWHLYVLRLKRGALAIDRDRFIEELNGRNIGTSVHFIPIPHHSYYKKKYGWRLEDYPVCADSFIRALSLPLNPTMTESDVADVIEAVAEIVGQFRISGVAA